MTSLCVCALLGLLHASVYIIPVRNVLPCSSATASFSASAKQPSTRRPVHNPEAWSCHSNPNPEAWSCHSVRIMSRCLKSTIVSSRLLATDLPVEGLRAPHVRSLLHNMSTPCLLLAEHLTFAVTTDRQRAVAGLLLPWPLMSSLSILAFASPYVPLG